jgi:hypothetical protein
MESEWMENAIKEASALLAKWQAGRVKLWDYTPTHFKVTLRVESRAISGNLHIVCGGSTFIRGPFSWDNCKFQVKRHPEGDGGMVLSDEGANFELHCRVVSVEENVEPIYTPNLGAPVTKE